LRGGCPTPEQAGSPYHGRNKKERKSPCLKD
jgi:hypothetical protein